MKLISKYAQRQRRIGRALLLCGLLFSAFAFAQTAQASAPSLVRSIEIDNVTVTLQSNFIPQGNFVPSPQMASALISQYHPYQSFSIQAIPYGRSAPNELSTVVTAGSTPVVTNALQSNRLGQGMQRVVGANPVAQLFGKLVHGFTYQGALALSSDAKTPVMITDWVTEARNRLWIIHAVQEIPGNTSALTVFKRLGTPIITSTTLGRPSAPISAGRSPQMQPFVAQAANVTPVPYPSWWSGDCDVNNHSGAHAYASWNGLEACGPGAAYQGGYDTIVHFPGATLGVAEFECVELSMRYLYLAYKASDSTHIEPYYANGRDVFYGYDNANYQVYNGSQWVTADFFNYDTAAAGSLLTKVYNGTVGQAPQAGDVMSYGADETYGHTDVVTSSNVDATGNGTVYTIDQNNAMTSSVSVQNWNVSGAIGWLHNPSSGTPSNPVYSNHAEYVVGSDHHLYNYLYQPSTNWTKQDISGTTATLQGSVASYLINGCHFAFAIDTSGDLQEYYRCSLSGSWTHSDLSTTLGVTFTGSPQGYAFNDPGTGAVHHSLNLVGSNGAFYNIFYTPATNWQKTLVSSAATFTGTPSGYAVVTSSSYELVYLVASNGTLYEFVHTSNGWASQNVFSSLASGVTAINSPSAYSYIDSSGDTDHSVFVLGSNHHVYNLVYRPATNWQTYDVSGSAITYQSSPSGHFSYQGNGLHFVYAVSSSGVLEEYYSADGTNTWTNVGFSATGLNGSPESYSYLTSSSATNTTHIIFFPETDGHLHEAAYTTSWSYVDIGLPATGVTVQSNADGYGF